jgi:chaperone modulatory protein CbpM
MKTQTLTVITGRILEEEPSLTLAELCINCNTPAETILKLVDHGIISPCDEQTTTKTVSQWQFQRNDLVRADKALRLKKDLGINLAGVALALELMDELTELRSQLSNLDFL